MGLRKSIRKIFRLVSLNIRYYKNIRLKNLNPDNYADPIILNPIDDSHEINIPKIIWMYWDSEIPPIVQKCFDQIKKLNPTYQINVLNIKNTASFCDLNFTEFNNLTPQQKSDLIRFYLLYHYGGIWLDGSIITYSNLDWIIDICNKNRTSAFGYYRAENVTVPEYPVIENWLLASEKGNIFFKKWLDELIYALNLGSKNYILEIKKTIPNYSDYFQKIGILEYLIAYVVCQKVLRETKASISLINCDKNAFLYQNIGAKSHTYFIESLILMRRPDIMPKLIKLIGSDRALISPYLLKQKFKKDSLIDF
ncbi:MULTISPECIES: glycosyltransferase family 32 protein [unclassified Acinetobacter]|uniref:glycosyltransferase family 32 protein n=1 Tax=unclassified Acinetobacter TaxID=196816 RepID=UPI0025C6FF99|nr:MULTISPECIES: capsular polysaccharide synthesis protein [unclassified Acinetobacter]